jgi:predicted hydrocarbon binding protein
MSVDHPVCHMATGFVYGLVRWATQGDQYAAVQTACAGMGDASCIIRVSRKDS